MICFRHLIALASVGVALSACGAARPPKAALDSAGRLLSAASARDRVAFEAEIDRPAVREDLRRQVAVLARGSALDVDGGPSDFALDRMVAPGALTVIGAPAGRAPPRAQLARLMKVIDRRHVCLSDAPGSSRCLLTFARGPAVAGRWRLVGMTLDRPTIRLAERAPVDRSRRSIPIRLWSDPPISITCGAPIAPQVARAI